MEHRLRRLPAARRGCSLLREHRLLGALPIPAALARPLLAAHRHQMAAALARLLRQPIRRAVASAHRPKLLIQVALLAVLVHHPKAALLAAWARHRKAGLPAAWAHHLRAALPAVLAVLPMVAWALPMAAWVLPAAVWVLRHSPRRRRAAAARSS